MRVLGILVVLLGVVPAAGWAACSAAPTGSTQDTVVQMVASGGVAGVGPVSARRGGACL